MSTPLEPVYTVYKTTCLANGKIYIGVHKTRDPDDAYLGSGTEICAEIKKLGRDQFQKEVLFVFDTPLEALEKEAELVTEVFVRKAHTYNRMKGGGYSPDKFFQDGERNSQYGTVWICKEGEKPRKIPSEDWPLFEAQEWLRGRSFSKRCREEERHREIRERRPRVLKAASQRMSEFNESQRGSRKLNWDKVDKIRRLHAEGRFTLGELAKTFGVSRPMIHYVVTEKTWIRRSSEASER